MTTERRRWTREAPDVRRQQLLDAAQDLILERGYEAMTISDVAEGAGVGKGTVYLYFSSKVEILEELKTRYWDRMLVIARDATERRARTWRGRWRHMLEDLVAYGIAEDELFHALYGGTSRTDIEPHEQLTDLIADLLRREQASGGIDLVDVEATARFIVSAYGGMVPWLVHSPPTLRRRRTSHVLEIIERAVGAT
jgi:AcrR family transcriptional regulator